MIKNVAPHCQELQGIFGHPCLVAAIGGRATCPPPGSDFWVLEEGGRLLAFLCRSGGGVYITGDPACAPQLEEFLPMMGYSQLLTDLPLTGAGTTTQLLAMEQTTMAAPTVLPRQQFSHRSINFSAVSFGMLQAACGAITKEEAAGYSVNLSAALRADAAMALLLPDAAGKAVAGAAIGSMAGGYALIEGVAVLPRYRWQGLGWVLTANVAAVARQRGLRPVLYCQPPLERVYRKAGFTPIEPLFLTERNP